MTGIPLRTRAGAPRPRTGPLALFDLDETLIAGDSDRLWGRFLGERGYGPDFVADQERCYRHYREGTLVVEEFLRLQLRPLSEHPLERLHRWRSEFLEDTIRPLLLARARELVAAHDRRGHVTAVVTATNRFISEPIARWFNVEYLLATEPEMRNERYTGEVVGVPCYAEGKSVRVRQWLAADGVDAELSESWYYSDSLNDLPLLSEVGHPVAVDPEPRLRAEAQSRGWPIVSLRDPSSA